ATAGDLASDLERWLRHEPISARPSTFVGRAVKWARRRPLQAALAGVIALSAVLSIFLGSAAARHRARFAIASGQNAMNEPEELFAKGEVGAALAQLAHLVRTEPANNAAAGRILSALSQRSIALPAGELVHSDEILAAEYSLDGRWILSAS